MTYPSGAGQTDKAHSVSIVPASDAAAGGTESGALTSATAGASGIFVIAVTTSIAPIDLSGANSAGLLRAIQAGKALSLSADFDLWYRWGTATGTVDETKTAADT